MKEVLTFKNNQFGQVRTINRDNGIWFALIDVCNILGIKNVTDTQRRLDSEERLRLNLSHNNKAWLINESGLYSVILRSDKPNAKPFRKWVTGEVLPSIRRTGTYTDTNTIETGKTLQAPITEFYPEYKYESYPPIPMDASPFESPDGKVVTIPVYRHNFLRGHLCKISDLQKVINISCKEIQRRLEILGDNFIYGEDYIRYDHEIYVNFLGKRKLGLNVYITMQQTPSSPYFDKNFIKLFATLLVNWNKFEQSQRIKIIKDIEAVSETARRYTRKNLLTN